MNDPTYIENPELNGPLYNEVEKIVNKPNP